MKKFILNADDFGKTQDHNRAVLNGYSSGFVKSASLMANGAAFDSAVNEILPECQQLSNGIHLNITEGRSLTRCMLLTNQNGDFNLSFIKLMLKSSNPEYKKEIEKEFRAQIEKVLAVTKADHIDTHCHTHGIPAIFKIVCKLAKEYNIPYVRTQYEEFYIVPKFKYMFHYKFLINLLKIILLNCFSIINKKTIKEFGLKTNNYILGVGYTGLMDANTIQYGLKTISDEDDIIVEALIHPCSYLRNINNSHSKEFKLTQDKILEDNIYRMGFEISNHRF